MHRVLALALVLYTYSAIYRALPKLPERIPTRFNWSGEPTGWNSPETLWYMLAAQFLSVALILAIPAIGRRAPQLVNLGMRRLSDYSPEVRDRIMPLLDDMCGYLALFFSLLLTYSVREIIRVALSPAARPNLGLAVAGFAGGMAFLLIYYLRQINHAAAESALLRSGQRSP